MGPIDPYLRKRMLLLLAGNLALLLWIALLLEKGASFTTVVSSAPSNIAPWLLASLALTGIISTGAIDLSIGSLTALAGSVFGILAFRNFPPMLCWMGAFGAAWAGMAFNGFLIRSFRLPAIIVTLAGLAAYRGVALIVADLGIPDFGGNISVQDDRLAAPGKMHAGVLLAAGIAVALFLETQSRIFRRWLALGNSEEALRLSGLPPGKVLRSAFAWGGLFFGLAATISATRVTSIEPSRLGLGFELDAVGAVVLGGTQIFGGTGTYMGTTLGCFFLYFIQQALIYANISPFYQNVITGGVILAVIGTDCLWHRKQKLQEELA